MQILTQLSRIIRREGIYGIINRVRHTPLQSFLPQRSLPSLAGGVRLVDHGHPELAAEIFNILAKFGIPLREGDNANQTIVWHVGIPPSGEDDGIIFMPPNQTMEKNVHWSRLKKAALVLDYDPNRLNAFRKRRGFPHIVAIPSLYKSEFSSALYRAIERALIYAEACPATARDYRPDLPSNPVPKLCLYLPEDPDRLSSFRREGLPGFHMIEGLRRQPGWIGAASSYRQIARALLDTGRSAAIICQDDAGPNPDFEYRFATSIAYWQNSGADLFSGLVTDVDDSFKITKVVRQDGMTFVHLNRSVGLVCSMFGRRALERLSVWDEQQRTVAEETIDRYLAATPNLDVVTCLPFLVRHRDGLASSIWGFRNGRYNTLIKYSENRLAQMVAEFENKKPELKT